jgi:hypothetical protein
MYRPLLAAALAHLVAAPAAAQTQANPADTCRNNAKFREQDFTLGSWDVYTGDKKTDEVTMTLILNDCAIEEHWTKTDGHPTGNGIGLFNYSRLLGSWGYTWATDDGAALRDREAPARRQSATAPLDADADARRDDPRTCHRHRGWRHDLDDGL